MRTHRSVSFLASLSSVNAYHRTVSHTTYGIVWVGVEKVVYLQCNPEGVMRRGFPPTWRDKARGGAEPAVINSKFLQL